MDKIEMLVGYDMNLFAQRFDENSNKLSTFMYNYFKATLGDKVAGMNVEENVLYSWTYYFMQIADENAEVGNNVMLSMLDNFNQLINSKDHVEIRGESEKPEEAKYLLLDETFCSMWFKTSICTMLSFLYGKENYEKAYRFLQDNYFSRNEGYRSMMLRQVEEA